MTDIPTASVESALLLAEGLARYRANGWPTEEIGGTSPRAAAIICALASEVLVTRHELALARRSRPRGFVVVHMRSPDDDDEGRPWCRTSDREVPDVPADDVTCRACFRRLNKAQKPPAARAHPPGSRNPEHDTKITQLVAEGRKLDEVGAMLGLTRERVRQIAKRGGAPPPLDRIRRAATEQATAAAEADLERRTRECVICRRSFVSMYNRTACDNEDCRWLHRQGGRYYLDPGFREAHPRQPGEDSPTPPRAPQSLCGGVSRAGRRRHRAPKPALHRAQQQGLGRVAPSRSRRSTTGLHPPGADQGALRLPGDQPQRDRVQPASVDRRRPLPHPRRSGRPAP